MLAVGGESPGIFTIGVLGSMYLVLYLYAIQNSATEPVNLYGMQIEGSPFRKRRENTACRYRGRCVNRLGLSSAL